MNEKNPDRPENTRSESELGFVLRKAKCKSGPELMRHVAQAHQTRTGAPPARKKAAAKKRARRRRAAKA